MLVFLDFDGVLRRDEAELFRLERRLVEAFEATMRQLPGAEIIVSSSWREGFPLPELRSHFSAEMRPRITGATPLTIPPGPHRRYREVLLFLKRKAPRGRAWVALDDQQEHYPPRPNIRILDSATGFDDAAAAWLLAMGRRYGAGQGIAAASRASSAAKVSELSLGS